MTFLSGLPFVESGKQNTMRREKTMNRTNLTFLLAISFLLLATGAMAQADSPGEPGEGPGQGNGVCQFIDEDGDGFNDLAPDHDGDGIPNGLDPDYVRPEDGTGTQARHQFGKLLGLFNLAFGNVGT